ncbi:MAG: hypothetical protein LIO93_12455 [Bacteroidales bacterium]|nr:hypothetical protein [Bacteroidales bacterium]
MVLIYFQQENTKRLQYIAEHIFKNILGTEFEITPDKKKYSEYTGPVINYSEEILPGIQILPEGLLTEKGIKARTDLNISQWKGLFSFFHTGKGTIPFDLFSASFYLLTLYEEHFSIPLDEHGRFNHTESLLYRNGVLEIPVIDRWAYFLKEELETSGYDTSGFRLRKYQAVSTYDIDHPFIYRNKGFVKNLGGGMKDFLKGNFKAVKERSLVQMHIKEDPYLKALMVIHEVQVKLNKPYYLFVLLGDRGKYGITTLYSPKRYYDYIRNLDFVKIGLHPSYKTFRNLEQLMKEKTELEGILGYKVDISRQHFLRMQSPETFQELSLAGITEDFTLAFAQAPGFRSGTAIPYHFYDVQKDELSGLLIRPTIMMDSTLIVHLKLTPFQALDKIKQLVDECKKSGGDYLSLWHNSNLAYSPQKNPWISVFVQSYKYAVKQEA